MNANEISDRSERLASVMMPPYAPVLSGLKTVLRLAMLGVFVLLAAWGLIAVTPMLYRALPSFGADAATPIAMETVTWVPSETLIKASELAMALDGSGEYRVVVSVRRLKAGKVTPADPEKAQGKAMPPLPPIPTSK